MRARAVATLTLLSADRPVGPAGRPEKRRCRKPIARPAYLLSDELRVVAAAPKFRSLLGAEIVAIGDVPVIPALSRLGRLVPSDNEWGRTELLEDYIRMPALLEATGLSDENGEVSLTSRKDGKEKRVRIAPADAVDALPVGPPRRPTPDGWMDARDTSAQALPPWQRHLDRPRPPRPDFRG